jgi:hypothetical protein
MPAHTAQGQTEQGHSEQAEQPFSADEEQSQPRVPSQPPAVASAPPRKPGELVPRYDDPDDPTPAPGNEIDAPPPELRHPKSGKRGRGGRGGGRDDRRGGGRPQGMRGHGGGHGGRGQGQRGGGRPQNRHASKPKVKYEGLPVDDDEPDAVPAARGPVPVRTPPPTASAPPPPIKVVRTGSADKHLADDVPVDTDSPPRRPRTYRDLDELPDFDE